MNWRRSILAPLLLSIAMPSAILAEEAPDDGIVIVEWSVRQEIEELIHDLRSEWGDLSERLDRTAELLKRYGNRPFAYNNRYLPVSQALAEVMDELKILSAFTNQFNTIAQRQLVEAKQTADPGPIRDVAIHFPGTDAALKAWRLLADRAWDRGQLGLYASLAIRSKEQKDPIRARRLEAAAGLLQPTDNTVIPENLEQINQMWGVTIPSFRSDTPQNNNQDRRLVQNFQTQSRPSAIARQPVTFSKPNENGLVAMSNGMELGVLDPLIGALTGPLIKIGNRHSDHQPIFDQNSNVISLGLSSQFELVITSSTSAGEVNWKSNLHIGNARSNRASSPIIIDGIIGIAVNDNQRDGSQLTLIGLKESDGSELFRIAIAKDSTAAGAVFRRNGGPMSPMLVSHRGTFAVANDSGVLAQVAPNGDLVSLWAARNSRGQFQQRNFGATNREPVRTAELFSDGEHIILSDRYGSGLTIATSDPATGELKARRYTGNASGDQLVAMRQGKALLAGRRISLLDLDRNEIIWSTPAPSRSGQTWGTMGADRALVIRNNTVSLFSMEDGKALSEIYFPQNNSIAVINDIVVTEQQGQFIGYGDGDRLRDRLTTAIRKDSSDFRPHIALYGLARATNNKNEAMSHMLDALGRGAPTRYAEEAASMLRPYISPRLNTSSVLDDIQIIRKLGTYDPALSTEANYWQARHLESINKNELAKQQYEALLTEQSALINLTPKIRADLRALVHAGLARLNVSELPAWLRADTTPLPSDQPTAVKAWEINGQPLLKPIISATELFAYRNGDIHAHNLSDGSLIWRRTVQADDQAMLGVRFRSDEPGIIVDVIPGSAAQSAGIRNGDRITAFEGKDINTTNELINLISTKKVGDPFSLRLARNENGTIVSKDVLGNLGIYLMAPVAANNNWIITQRMSILSREGNSIVQADTQPAELRVIDRRTGKELWKRVLPLTVQGQNPPRPLLTNSHLIIEFEGDLVAFDLRPTLDGGLVSENADWTLKGVGSALHSPQILGKGFLVLSDDIDERLRLLQLNTGKILFEIPAIPGDTKLHLNQGDLIIEDVGNGLSIWDLGKGSKRWQLNGKAVAVVSFNRDTVFAINERQQLVMLERANGNQRRLLNDFPQVESVSVNGRTGYVHGRRENGQQFIASIGLQSGTTQWIRSVPVGAEVRDIPTAHNGGVTLELVSRGNAPSLLTFGVDGEIKGVGDPEEGELISLPQGALTSNENGIQMIQSALPEKSASIKAINLPGQEITKKIIQQAWDQLSWEGPEGARYALAQQSGDIAFIFNLDKKTNNLIARIGNSGPELDPHGQKLSVIRNRVPSLKSHAEGWRMKSYQRLPNGPKGNWRGVVVLSPPILMDPLRKPEIFITSELEPGSGAWWLRRLWRPIEQQSVGL